MRGSGLGPRCVSPLCFPWNISLSPTPTTGVFADGWRYQRSRPMMAPMRAAAGLPLLALFFGCAGPQEGIGLKGVPRSREEETVKKTDIKSVTMRKGALVAGYDAIADESCGGHCNFHREAMGRLELTIAPQGVARVVDAGEQLEQFRSVAGDTRFKLTWDRRWEGSWSEGQGQFVITLRPKVTTCERRAADGGSADDPCKAVPLELVCDAGSIDLFKPKNKAARAWVCRPRGRVVAGAGLTPFPWIFGVDYQVDTSDRAQGNGLVRFFLGDPPPEPPPKKSST